jgi:tetratricopeptide (TPR) repeat protein
MKFSMHITIFILIKCALVLFSVSCTKAPEIETIRLYARASQAYSAGRFSETAEILHKEKKFHPALVLRAKAEYFSGNLENAEKTCRLALKKRPSSFEAKLFLSRILREKDDLSGAVKLTESLLADNPQDIRTLRLAAEFAFEAGKLDEAAALLDRAAEFSAESAMVLLDRARLRWVSGMGNETAMLAALEDLSRARAMLPWDTPLLRAILNLENTIKEVM